MVRPLPITIVVGVTLEVNVKHRVVLQDKPEMRDIDSPQIGVHTGCLRLSVLLF